MRKLLPAGEVDNAYAIIFRSYTPNTHESYAAGLKRFTQYCDLHEIPERTQMPAPYYLLAAFIAAHVGQVGGGTVKAWMSGLKVWHDIHTAPWEGLDRWVELARRTANKEGTSFAREQCGPVTIAHMVALRAILNPSKPFDAAVWALATAAFWGCCRLGELTVPSTAEFDPKFHITRAASMRLITAPDGISVTVLSLPWTKSTRERRALLTLTRCDDKLCAQKALSNHLQVNADLPPDAPFFAYRANDTAWAYPTKDHFLRRCHDIWTSAKLLCVHGHSFRIGGSTELLLAGVPCDVVAALGGWTSLAFLLYWRKLEHIIPQHVGKAYTKDKVDEVSKAFEAFRIAHRIIIVEPGALDD
jgi:hypothetical protein